MAKYFVISLVFSVCVYVGVSVRSNYKKCVGFLCEYIDFLDYAKERIAFERAELGIIKRGFNCKLFAKTLETDGQDVPAYVSRDNGAIKSFLGKLGKSDLDNTIESIRRERDRASASLRSAEKELKQKGELAEKLCLLLAVSVVVILI